VWSQYRFSHRLDLDGISGKTHTHYGIDGAISGRGGRAVALGWLHRSEWIHLSIRLRALSPAYTAIRSAPAAAYGSGNERGVSASVRFRPGGGNTVEGFIDRHGTVDKPGNWPVRRLGTRSRLSATHRFSRHVTGDVRIATVTERSQKTETRDRYARGFRLRFRTRGSNKFQVWAERVSGRNPTIATALAAGGELGATVSRLKLNLWFAHGRSTGTAARIYAFRPEVWGGRSVISLPRAGSALTIRASTELGPLKTTAAYHALPVRRISFQAELSR